MSAHTRRIPSEEPRGARSVKNIHFHIRIEKNQRKTQLYHRKCKKCTGNSRKPAEKKGGQRTCWLPEQFPYCFPSETVREKEARGPGGFSQVKYRRSEEIKQRSEENHRKLQAKPPCFGWAAPGCSACNRKIYTPPEFNWTKS